MREILVYHDLGAPSHYRALEIAAKQLNAKVVYGEFAFVKKFYKDLSQGRAGGFKRFIENLNLFITLSIGVRRPELIVLGVAPFDWRIIFLLPLMMFSHVQLHTSWPHWDGTFNAMKPRMSWIIEVWRWVFKSKISHVYFVTDIARKNCEAANFLIKSYSIVQHSLDVSIYKWQEVRKPEPLVIGYVGRLEAQKGVEIIFRMADRFQSKGILFYVAGDGALTPEAQKLNDRGVLNYVGHISSQSELALFYSRLHCILLPSLRSPNWEELFGMVLIEAAACGAIPITTDHIGPKEVVKVLGDGIVFSESVYEELAASYIEGFQYDRERARQLSERASNMYSLGALSEEWRKGLLTAID